MGTRKPFTPSSVRAQTTATSATGAFVIHIFPPWRIQSSPSRVARVFIEPGSEPWSCSVSPKHPIDSPAAIDGNQACFCSSDPYFQIANIAREP
jgi:hypothetical protein